MYILYILPMSRYQLFKENPPTCFSHTGVGGWPHREKWPLYRQAPIMFPEKDLPPLTFPFFPSLPLWLPKVGWKNHLSLLAYPYLPECRDWYGFQQERNKIMFNPTTGCKQSKPIPMDFLAKCNWEPLLHSHWKCSSAGPKQALDLTCSNNK